MNRRDFVSRVSFGTAALCAAPAPSTALARSRAGLTVRFIGMMGFIGRTDGSFLVAAPGDEMHGHLTHRPFLMARAGSPVARALDMKPAVGVVPGAFDMTLDGVDPSGFAYRCLENTSIDIAGGRSARVRNRSTQMADLSRIVPGARVRGNVERWATARIALSGGAIEDSAAHPDAGRFWSFGGYRQRLTDAVNYVADADTRVRLATGAEVRTFDASRQAGDQLWVVSAALPRDVSTPTRLEHSHVAFEFLANGNPVVAECADAVGREVPPTELPCAHASSAALAGAAAGRMFPPFSELCFLIIIIRGS